MDSNSRIYVAGHKGLVGSAIVRNLKGRGYNNISSATSDHWDLRVRQDVDTFFRINNPEYVFLAAAKVGGIHANNKYPAEFIHDNLMIQTNVIDSAYRNGVKKLVFLGSSCIYPKMATQPITEDALMTGPLEPTNDAYATAKIAGIRMCRAYRQQYGFNAISLMPTNLYGPNDNFDLLNSHVLPAMIRKFHEATDKVTLWGDGSAMREFLHVDDLAEACYTCMEKYDEPEPINVGTGEDVTIKELAEIIADIVGNKIIWWDTSKPNGTPKRPLDYSKISSLGWKHTYSLERGLEEAYTWFKMVDKS